MTSYGIATVEWLLDRREVLSSSNGTVTVSCNDSCIYQCRARTQHSTAMSHEIVVHATNGEILGRRVNVIVFPSGSFNTSFDKVI